jgi:hypothetical protein
MTSFAAKMLALATYGERGVCLVAGFGKITDLQVTDNTALCEEGVCMCLCLNADGGWSYDICVLDNCLTERSISFNVDIDVPIQLSALVAGSAHEMCSVPEQGRVLW